jgi:hypothetical protein
VTRIRWTRPRAERAAHPTWSDLPASAKAFRVAHATWAVVSLICLGVVWHRALRGGWDRRLVASVAWLSIEGVALVAGRGDCPFGPMQARLGDPVPLFELVLPPRAAKAAIPILAIASVAGIAAAAVRGVPRAAQVWHADRVEGQASRGGPWRRQR